MCRRRVQPSAREHFRIGCQRRASPVPASTPMPTRACSIERGGSLQVTARSEVPSPCPPNCDDSSRSQTDRLIIAFCRFPDLIKSRGSSQPPCRGCKRRFSTSVSLSKSSLLDWRHSRCPSITRAKASTMVSIVRGVAAGHRTSLSAARETSRSWRYASRYMSGTFGSPRLQNHTLGRPSAAKFFFMKPWWKSSPVQTSVWIP